MCGSGRQGKRWREICRDYGHHNVRFDGREQQTPGCRVEADAVIVATPPDMHLQPVLNALAADVPVLVEKPLARRLADNERILDALLDSSAPLLVGYTHLFAPFFAEPRLYEDVRIVWRGEQRDDGSCSPELDWGSHAIAMGIAMRDWGCSPKLEYGRAAQRNRSVSGDGRVLYTPGHLELIDEWEAFERLCRAKEDWRARFSFTAAVALLANEEGIGALCAS